MSSSQPPPTPSPSSSAPAPASADPTLTAKRKADSNAHDPAISPPPTKRKIQSSVSSKVVANFFTPTSQKPAAKTSVIWEERAPVHGLPVTLLVGTCRPDGCKDVTATRKRWCSVAAFDLDSTLITTASGKKHAVSATDWKWWDASVPKRLRDLHDQGFIIVILSNQGGLVLPTDIKIRGRPPPPLKPGALERLANFKQKCAAVLTELGVPVKLYAATGRDQFRKPRIGMWQEMVHELELLGEEHGQRELDYDESFFVGDAAGRVAILRDLKLVPQDFGCSDRNMAANIGLDFQTPEEYFLGEAPRHFARDFDLADYPFDAAAAAAGPRPPGFSKTNRQELVVLTGPPGAGKSTFCRTYLERMGYERVNQDLLRSKDRCIKRATALLESGKSVVIDNTNPDPASRSVWIDIGIAKRVVVRCVWFNVTKALCEHNEAVRWQTKSLNPEERGTLPRFAFNAFFSRFQEPKTYEGFYDVTRIDFKFTGTAEEYEIWGTYWL
ncbi:DNA kinase/phosphatase Pnk1 [Sporothrix epigloea]|uniref:DNA kinase/phosphatase Pnk1 n=1 Tax=Sporothrix epigloea TaxID=1892477 RepID=A0ABP0E6F6_9PEZI